MTDITETIKVAANRWMNAWVQQDAAVLEASLAPDFALVVSATPALRLDRSSWVQTACSRYAASEFRYRDVQVREIGPGLALMSSIAEFSAEVDGAPRTGPMFIVDVYRSRLRLPGREERGH